MDSFSLLKREIKEYIYDQKWQELTKIQVAAIQQVTKTDNNLILCAPTASGKTEAAFLPAINKVNDFDKGIKIIYISPLIALINDQFKRMSDLCDYLNINVTRWHGEAPSAQKRKLLKKPSGILLITPESIEAMLTLRKEEAQYLLAGVEWVLVDEIHGFLDSNRGLHLKSMLERCQRYMLKEPRYIGMSATLNTEDSLLVKSYFKNNKDTNILIDRTKNDLEVTRDFFIENDQRKSEKSIEAIYKYSQQESMLIFPNSRGLVESISVDLNKKAKKNNSTVNYFAHHSSLTKNSRIDVENFAKTAKNQLFTICCTSTLEMGIDIGAVDSIVQYNAPYSVSSLGQRLGRSGRKTKKSILHFIATTPFDLLKGLAAISLYERSEIERLDGPSKPYDLFAHQLLAMLLEHSGLKKQTVFHLNQQFKNWNWLNDEEIKKIVTHLLEEEFIESIGEEFITGVATEPLLTMGRFFSQFSTPSNYSVFSDVKKIGEIPLDIFLEIDSNILLVAKIWKIKEINHENKKIIVLPANDGKPPKFFSLGGETSHLLANEMLALIKDIDWIDSLNSEVQEGLTQLRAQQLSLTNPFVIYLNDRIAFRTFAGTKINYTLQILFSIIYANELIEYNDNKMSLFIDIIPDSLKRIVQRTKEFVWSKKVLVDYLINNPTLVNKHMSNIKYQKLLPFDIQVNYVIENCLNLPQTLIYLEEIEQLLNNEI